MKVKQKCEKCGEFKEIKHFVWSEDPDDKGYKNLCEACGEIYRRAFTVFKRAFFSDRHHINICGEVVAISVNNYSI